MDSKQNKTTPEQRAASVIRRMMRGRFPRQNSKLGKLLRDVEKGLKADQGKKISGANSIRIALALQLLVIVAELPAMRSDQPKLNPSFRWAVDSLREVLADLDKPVMAKKKPKAMPSLEDILNETE